MIETGQNTYLRTGREEREGGMAFAKTQQLPTNSGQGRIQKEALSLSFAALAFFPCRPLRYSR
jgi:hypothetical protein